METSNTFVKTAGGHTVVFRPFITGRAKRNIEAAFTEDVQLRNEDSKTSFTMAASKADIAKDRAITAAVVSVDEKTENVLELVLDLPMADFDEVLKKVDEITGGEKKEVSTPKI